jgi:hypothetical protein
MHFLISSSITGVSASPIFSARTGTILSNTSGLAGVSRILSVTFVIQIKRKYVKSISGLIDLTNK